MQQQHWLIKGDFNMITSLAENKGGIRILDAQNETFKSIIENLILIGIPSSSGLFTWNNRRKGKNIFWFVWTGFW
jgi:hypothetical protein